MRLTFVCFGIVGALLLTLAANSHYPVLLWDHYFRKWLLVGYGHRQHIRDWNVPLVYTGASKWRQWRFENTDESLGDCSWLQSIVANVSNAELIGRGWNKNVYRRGDYAVKKINFRGTALVSCMDESDGDYAREGDCLKRSAEKFIKEIGVLQSLQGDLNVPTLHGYCIPSDYVLRSDDLFMVTDVGAPLDMLHLVQMDWTKRLGLFREIVDFVQRIRPFVLKDLRRQQFIFDNVKAMYADFDDVTSCPDCDESEDHSAAARLYDAFVRDLFQFGNPENSHGIIEIMKNKYDNSTLTLIDLKTHADELHNLTTGEL
ncbi:hypothetical protein QR680_006099 [Steinernema hermaphroditum]|uniref:Protein kinase domain-containing protein n=1 Tax=Steinernema hermaphroditum TaxID=289476 RepID=A0AA39HWM2_9BILA|nr:hypothetical protein QR680_006099 [Steinernema hermaphroditum]